MRSQKNILLKDSNKNVHHKFSSQHLKLKVEEEHDVSMMSITNESTDIKYFLPTALELESDEVAKKYLEDAAKRRDINRELTLKHVYENPEKVSKISFENEIGKVLILEILDSMQDFELSLLPLGSDFMKESIITSKQRMDIANWLLRTCTILNVDRHSAYSGMILLDRYVKVPYF